MITWEQATLACATLVAVLDQEGMEVTVIRVYMGTRAVYGTNNSDTERKFYTFDELSPSRTLLTLEAQD